MTKSKKKGIVNNHTTKYANQHKYAIIPEEIVDGQPYLRVGKETIYEAMKDLNPAAFKVWTYLSAQANTGERCTWDLSPKAISNVTGLHINGIRKAITEMEDKHYIVKVEGKPRSKAFFLKKREGMDSFTEARWE